MFVRETTAELGRYKGEPFKYQSLATCFCVWRGERRDETRLKNSLKNSRTENLLQESVLPSKTFTETWGETSLRAGRDTSGTEESGAWQKTRSCCKKTTRSRSDGPWKSKAPQPEWRRLVQRTRVQNQRGLSSTCCAVPAWPVFRPAQTVIDSLPFCSHTHGEWRRVVYNKGMVLQCADLLKYMGIPCVQSNGEAEATCAALNSAGVGIRMT